MSQPRSRTYEWIRPSEVDEHGEHLSGLDFLSAMREGAIPHPPICHTMDFFLETVEKGRVVWTARPAEFHYNPLGTVHGGFFSTILDSAMACAVHSTLAAGSGYTTLEFKVNIVRPLTSESGAVRCEGWVVHRGSRIATAEGRVVDAAGKVYAHGSTTCMVFETWAARGGKDAAGGAALG